MITIQVGDLFKNCINLKEIDRAASSIYDFENLDVFVKYF